MACGCQYQRAGGRYLDERAGGVGRPGLKLGAVKSTQPRAQPQPLNRCWLPADVVAWFRQPWIQAWMNTLDGIEKIPAIGGLVADLAGGGFVVRNLVLLIQNGCDLSTFSAARSREIATKLEANAAFFQNAFVIGTLDAAATLFAGIPLGTAMNALAPAMRCAARALRAMAGGQVEGACLFAECLADALRVLQGFGVDGAEMVPELRRQLAECAAKVRQAPPWTINLPALPPGWTPPQVGIAKPATGGAGLIVPAALGYLFFLR